MVDEMGYRWDVDGMGDRDKEENLDLEQRWIDESIKLAIKVFDERKLKVLNNLKEKKKKLNRLSDKQTKMLSTIVLELKLREKHQDEISRLLSETVQSIPSDPIRSDQRLPSVSFVLDKQKAITPQTRTHPLREIWNEHCGDKLPKCKALSDARLQLCQKVLRIYPEVKTWIELAKFLSTSSWHTGSNDRNWVANFDFFVREKTILSFMEKSLCSQRRKSVSMSHIPLRSKKRD